MDRQAVIQDRSTTQKTKSTLHMPEPPLTLGRLEKQQSHYGTQAGITKWPAPRTEITRKIPKHLRLSVSGQLLSLQTHVSAAVNKAEELVS